MDADAARQAVQQWKNQAVNGWKEWYRSVRPYEERDDLPER
jgi:hypothetical protein